MKAMPPKRLALAAAVQPPPHGRHGPSAANRPSRGSKAKKPRKHLAMSQEKRYFAPLSHNLCREEELPGYVVLGLTHKKQ